MKTNVKFFYKTRSFTVDYGPTYLSLIGSGTVFFQETGLILDGEVPKLNMGWFFRFAIVRSFLWLIYRKTIGLRTIRTIPYSKILDYKRPSLLDNSHLLVYEPLDSYESKVQGKKIRVRFKILNLSKSQQQSFADRLQDYIAAAKTLSNNN